MSAKQMGGYSDECTLSGKEERTKMGKNEALDPSSLALDEFKPPLACWWHHWSLIVPVSFSLERKNQKDETS